MFTIQEMVWTNKKIIRSYKIWSSFIDLLYKSSTYTSLCWQFIKCKAFFDITMFYLVLWISFAVIAHNNYASCTTRHAFASKSLKRNKIRIILQDEIANIFLLRCFSHKWCVSTLEVKVQFAPSSVKLKMEALTLKWSISKIVSKQFTEMITCLMPAAIRSELEKIAPKS